MAPVKTEVQRTLVANGSTAFATVNGGSLAGEAGLESESFDRKAFESELQRVASTHPDQLKLEIRYQMPQPAEATRASIKSRLSEIAHSCGFEHVGASTLASSASWESVMGPVQQFPESEDPSEAIFENELARVFALRTRLSKLVIGDADCVVEIKQPFDGRQKELSDPLREFIRKAVTSMDFETQKGKLLYRVSTTEAGESDLESIFDPRLPVPIRVDAGPAIRALLERQAAEYQPSPALELALDLGFNRIGYTHSPGGGAPQKLIGQRAPNFTLRSLAGEDLELAALIENRPALVTFWGVACGPCRQEAPHLTQIHEQHGADFAVLAVNGYDEGRDVVADYVERAKLTHPIVIRGADVADDLYHVGSYPTTFWIDRHGTVLDYDVGFDSGEVMMRRVRDMLGD
ncbi:TlpA family protein disulfide reductase [Roseiconus nitratireducens]|uniref:TlpA family protein disulfide reductase n=1 Tax=Roseiconus nitratireducens TaxID=2605748 RepID=UPI00137550EE|nr:TlpA disulfide reductase family protein [Roseiconus nitratireducens]